MSVALNGIGPGAWDARRVALNRSYRHGLVPYKASPELEAFLLANAPPHYATDAMIAPSSLEELRAAYETQGPSGLPVYPLESELSIYSRPEVFRAYRAWHDALHVELDAPFNEDGECMVAMETVRLAKAAGLSREDCTALWIEIMGQFDYLQQHGGEWPEHQALFVAAAFKHGMKEAAALDF